MREEKGYGGKMREEEGYGRTENTGVRKKATEGESEMCERAVQK